MPLHHIGGIVTGFSSLVSGGTLIYTEAFEAKAFCAHIAGDASGEAHRPTWYYASPTIHHAVAVEAKQRAPPHALRLVRSGAASLPSYLMSSSSRLLAA